MLESGINVVVVKPHTLQLIVEWVIKAHYTFSILGGMEFIVGFIKLMNYLCVLLLLWMNIYIYIIFSKTINYVFALDFIVK